MPVTYTPGPPAAFWTNGSGPFVLGNDTTDGTALGDLAMTTIEQHCFEQSRSNNLGLATALQVAAQAVQLGLYYDKADEAIDARDNEIDTMQAFQEDLDAYACGADFEMVNCKKAILTDLGLPVTDKCSDAVRYASESLKDGEAVDCKSDHLAQQSCEGIPSGWGTHDGSLFAGRAGSYAGGIIANASKRRTERFREQKTNLVLRAQQAMKAAINSNTILGKYAQATSIHSGLADLFIQGFNSAGAGLGVALGQLAGGFRSNPASGASAAAVPTPTSSSTPDVRGPL